MSSYKFDKTLNKQLTTKEKMCRMSVTSSKKDTKLGIEDVKAINKMLRKQLTNKRDKYTIYLHGIVDHPICIKSYADEDINFDYIEDYINGLVKSTGKFKEFFKMEILYHQFSDVEVKKIKK